MPFRPFSRGLSALRREPVFGAKKKVVAMIDAYYVLTKAEASLTYSKLHPNSGSPDYDVVHNVSDLVGDTDDLSEGTTNLYYTDARVGTYGDAAYLKIDGSNANTTVNIGSENFTTTGTLGTGVGTLSGNNTTGSWTALNLTNTHTPATTQILQTVDLVFNLTQSVSSVITRHEAAKISAYKVSDWFHATTEADTDSGLKFYTTDAGISAVKFTLNNVGLGTFAGGLDATGSLVLHTSSYNVQLSCTGSDSALNVSTGLYTSGWITADGLATLGTVQTETIQTPAGALYFGAADSDEIYMVARMIMRTLADDPINAGPIQGSTGEMAMYNGMMYICTDGSGPTWELIHSS